MRLRTPYERRDNEEDVMLDVIVSGIGAVAVLVAAVFWFWASKVEVPNNIDTFIDVLKK